MNLNEQTILKGYSLGIFPMSESFDDPKIYWINPKKRGIIPIKDFKISKSLKKEIKKNKFKITINKNFNKVITNCAKKTKNRPKTWINKKIIVSYSNLHKIGHAHSIEAWFQNKLVGGLYGVSLPYLKELGAIEISRKKYLKILGNSLKKNIDFNKKIPQSSIYEDIQSMTQTS